MITTTKLAVAALVMFGIASSAQAGGRDDADHSGGFRTGPLGQGFTSGVNPVDHPSTARSAYASSARNRHPAPARPVPNAAGRAAYGYYGHMPTVTEPANIAIQDRFYRNSIGQ